MSDKQFLLRKVKHSDGSTSYWLCIKHNSTLSEIRLKAYQYKEMKKTCAFECAETDYSIVN